MKTRLEFYLFSELDVLTLAVSVTLRVLLIEVLQEYKQDTSLGKKLNADLPNTTYFSHQKNITGAQKVMSLAVTVYSKQEVSHQGMSDQL